MGVEPALTTSAPSAGAVERIASWCAARRWAIAVWAGAAVWSVVLFWRVQADHAGFRTARLDLGNMVQAVWSTAQGRPLEVTDVVTGEQAERLGAHVDPILVLLAPLWMLWPTPLTLIAAQIAAVACGAVAVFWLGRRHLGSDAAAACVALAYLAYPWVVWTAADPIHPVTFAIPLLLFAFWFLDGDRLWAFAAAATLAALTGELVALTIAGLGVWYAVARGRRAAGLAIAGAGVAWTLIALKVVVPAFSGGNESPFYGYYEAVGGSPEGLVRTLFTDPGAVASALTSSRDLLYPALLAIPLLGAFLLAPALAAVALPQFAVNALADRASTVDPRHHYIAAIVPVLFAATVLGLARLGPGRARRAALLVLGACVVSLAAVGPLTSDRTLSNVPDLPRRHVDALRDAVSLVPDGAPVATTNLVGAHLSERRRVLSVPVVDDAEWVVIDTWNPWVPAVGSLERLRPGLVDALVTRLRRSSRWSTVFERDGVLVFRRNAA